jgi:hypothetical protein
MAETMVEQACRVMAEAKAEVLSLRARNEALEASLREIAAQELSADMSVDDQLGGDFEGAYNQLIEIARAAIKKAAE